MKRVAVIGLSTVLVGVLAAALLFSRSPVEEASAPHAPQAGSGADLRSGFHAQEVEAPQPGLAVPGVGAGADRAPPLADIPTSEAASPFVTEDSEELDYAVTLIFRPDAGPDEWRNAAEVFERCVKAVPGNERCYRGLVAAQRRLAGEEAGPAEALRARPSPSPEDAKPKMLGAPKVPAANPVTRPVPVP